MVKTYRTVQQWDHWLTHFLGQSVLETEHNFLSPFLTERYGKHALLIGVPKQSDLLKSSVMPCHIVLSPLIHANKYIKYIESDFYELPITPGSVDLVILPHTFEFIDNPHQLLNEACRVVKPEGDIIIFGFKPVSLWGFKKWWVDSKNVPWSGNFLPAAKIKHWLKLADFELVRQNIIMFRPPIRHHGLYKKLKFLDWVGTQLHLPFGNIYVLIARAKTIPLTPIKLHWKQKLSPISISIPGPTSMRDCQ